MNSIQKRLESQAVDIKGKQYVLVKDRVMAFHELNPNGSIVTELVSSPESKMVMVRAVITPDVGTPERVFTGFSQAIWGDGRINSSAALENAETSAVGRALAFLGIGVIDSIASVDEINKAEVAAVTKDYMDEAERQVNAAKEAAIKLKQEKNG